MDIKRITSSLLGFPLVLIVLLIGNVHVVDIALTIIAILAIDEYFNAISKIAKPVRWVGYLSCFSIALIHLIPETYLTIMAILGIHEEYDVSQSMLSIACDTSSSLSNYHKEQQSKCQ